MTGVNFQKLAVQPVGVLDDFINFESGLNIKIITTLPQTTASGSTPVCVGANIYLYDTASYTVTSYHWIGPAGSGAGGTGFTAATRNAINTGFSGTGVSQADQGTYSIVVTHNGCPNDTTTVNIVVNKSKTVFMVLNMKKQCEKMLAEEGIPIGESTVKPEKSTKLLGMKIEESQGWNEHFNGPNGLISSLNFSY